MGEPTTLECDHCGDVADESDADGLFVDGQGGECMSCGFPGTVSCDEETEPWWNTSQEAGTYCRRVRCAECRERKLEAETATLRAALKEALDNWEEWTDHHESEERARRIAELRKRGGLEAKDG